MPYTRNSLFGLRRPLTAVPERVDAVVFEASGFSIYLLVSIAVPLGSLV